MSKTRCVGLAILASSWMTVAVPAVAEEAEQGAKHSHTHGPKHIHTEIEEIVVQASPLDRSLVELSQSVTVLTGSELQREVTNNIGDTLTRLPGLSNASFGQNVGRPVIRGMQGQRVGVLLNNMASGDASAVSQDHAVSVEPFLADQVEVIRGPSTLLYGSGAIGGIVNIVTNTIPREIPERPVSGRAIAQLDSAANQRFAGGRLDFGHGSFAFHANAFYRRTDDYEIPGEAELYPDHIVEENGETAEGILENSFLDNQGGALGTSWIGDRWQAGVSWTGYDSNYGIPGGHHHHHEGHDEHEECEETHVHVDLESQRWDAELTGHDPFTGIEQLKFKFADIDYTHTEFEGENVGTVFDSNTTDTRLELSHDPWGAINGAFGLQYRGVNFSAMGAEAFVPDTDTTTWALFWLESVQFGSWQLDLGFRYEDIGIDVLEIPGHDHPDEHDSLDEDPPEHFGFSPFSVSLGAIWHISQDSHFSFNLSRAERAPNAQELLAHGPHIANQTFEIGDQYLEAESNLHGEIGYRLHGGKLTGNIVIYSDDFDSYIYQENTGQEEHGLPVMQWSQQDAEFIGGEVELRYDIGHFTSGHWQLSGFYDRIRATLDNGENVPLMPPSRIGLGMDWHSDLWSVTANWIHASDQNRLADQETATPGYDLLNGEVSWLVPNKGESSWEVFLKGHNLLNEDIRNSTSHLKDKAPQIGRNFILGLRAKF